MKAIVKTHSKVKSQQLPHVKNIETVQGPNHWTDYESDYPMRAFVYKFVHLPFKGPINTPLNFYPL